MKIVFRKLKFIFRKNWYSRARWDEHRIIDCGWFSLIIKEKIKYNITGEYMISGRGKVITVEFQKPVLRKDINLLGKKIKGLEIVGVELRGTGNDCYHKDAGLLVKEKLR